MPFKFKTKFNNKVGEGGMQGICLACGLCCNGVLFADVRLENGDDALKLKTLGLRVSKSGRFKQPCSALQGCKCAVYADRPDYCRKFECLLFKKVQKRETLADKALAVIKKAQAAVARVENLLEELGSDDRHLPLQKRFQVQLRRMEAGSIGAGEADVFAELTVAFHELNLLLREEFYP